MLVKKLINQQELSPGIIVYSCPDKKIKKWLEVIETYSDPLLKYGGIVKKNESGYYSTVGLDHRKCKVFSGDDIASCHPDDPLMKLSIEVQDFMDSNVNNFCQKYKAHQAKKNHEIIFLRYEDGDFFNEHNDDCPAFHRTVSSVMYFNDNYNGGEICFKHFNIEYKPKQGDCIVFSSAFPYMHSVNPISGGVRYAAVNWYKYI